MSEDRYVADECGWRRELLERLVGVDPMADVPVLDGALRGLIRWLDLTVPAEETSIRQQALTRAIAAACRVLVRQLEMAGDHPVFRTIAAADAYCRAPDEQTYTEYLLAATGSYPYGAGDGCLSIDDDGDGPGSGCQTGSGTLYQVAHQAGAGEVLAAIRRELEPWLSTAVCSHGGQMRPVDGTGRRTADRRRLRR